MLLSATPTKIYRVVLDVGQGFNSTAVERKKVERRSLVKKSLFSAAGEASHATHETESEGFFFKRKSDRKSLRISQSKDDFIGRECGEEVRTTWIKEHHINQLIRLLEFCSHFCETQLYQTLGKIHLSWF